MAVLFATIVTILYNLGLGRHVPDMQIFGSPKFAEYFYFGHVLGFIAPLFGRISFCLYMLRVLGVVSVSRRVTIWTVIALQVVINVTIAILVFTQCGSFYALWKHGFESDTSTCIRHDTARALALGSSTFNAFTDLYLTVLPAVVVWKIRVMDSRTKFGIAATLGLSIFASAASIAKIYFINVLYSPMPTSKTFGQLYITMSVEINIVIIVASLPILAPLVLNRGGRSSTSQAPVLATYESSVEATSNTSKMLSTWNTSDISNASKNSVSRLLDSTRRGSFLTNPFYVRKDSFPRNILPQSQTKEACVMSDPFHVTKTVDIAVNVAERGEDTLEDSIVPQPLHDDCSKVERSEYDPADDPVTPWEELPTLPFLGC